MNGSVELFAYRQGIEDRGIEPLVDAIGVAHEAEFGTKVGRPAPPHCSMWRDVNVFNELKIPAVTYGPAASAGGGNYSMLAEDLYRAARIYAATALDLCSRPVAPKAEHVTGAR